MQNGIFLCLGFLCLSLQINAAQYRSANSGDWNFSQNWQIFSGSWTVASLPPGANDQVTIQAGHAIQIISVDAEAFSIQVEAGGFLHLAGISLSLTIHNGSADADLVVDGTYQDDAGSGAGNGTFFNGGATWALGSSGTFIKTSNSSAARYRDFYHNGMSNIPASANWIIRYTGAGSPSFTTNNTFYPNLIFESYAGPWFPASGFSRFQGISATATIYGNLDIGGSGGGSVTIINENTYFAPIQIYGACFIKSGSTLTTMGNANGTGFALRGQLSVAGNLLISGSSSLLRLNGFGTQQISGEGDISLSVLEVNNPNGISLLRPLEIGIQLTLSIGNILLNAFDLTVRGIITGASASAYIQTNGFGESAGSLIQNVAGSVFFPVGNNSYNLAILTHNGGGDFKVRVEDVVWTEGDTGIPLLNNVVGRTWYVDGNISSFFSLTLQWNAFDQRPGFDPNWCYISQNSGSGWSAEPPGMATGFGPFTKTRSGISQSGAFAIASSGVLPIVLSYFKVTSTKKEVNLKWQTEQEINFSHFEVERSQDGQSFNKIATVPGNGDSEEPQYYQYDDNSPSYGYNYYRLKQVDFDGTFEYSPIKAVEFSGKQLDARLYPTVVQDQLYLEISPSNSGIFQIISSTSRLCQTAVISKNQNNYQLDVSGLPAGVYLLRVEGNHRVQILRFIKV